MSIDRADALQTFWIPFLKGRLTFMPGIVYIDK